MLLLTKALAQTKVPLELNDDGHLYIKVQINDQESARFMFDTGGGVNIISAELFNKIHSKLHEAGLHTGTRHNGEKITGMLYEIPSVSIGGFRKTGVIAGKLDDPVPYDGIISMNFFEDVPVTLDFVNKELIIETKASLSKISPATERIHIRLFRNGKDELSFFVTICLDDKEKAEAEFDTGASANMLMLHPRYMELLNINKPAGDTKDYGYYKYSATLPKLSYCNTGLFKNNVFVGFKEGLIFDGLVGYGIFLDKKLTIDVQKSEMLVWH